jgi:hypothetical protein
MDRFLSRLDGSSGSWRSPTQEGEVTHSGDQPQSADCQHPQPCGADEEGSVTLAAASGVED